MPEDAKSNGERLQEWREGLVQSCLPRYGPPNAKNEYLALQRPTAEFDHGKYDGFPDIEVYPSPSDCEGCPICDFHFESASRQEVDSLVYSESLNDADANACILRLQDSILDHLKYLRGKLETHGDNLLKRWQKIDRKSLQARLKTSGIEEKALPQVERYYQHDWGWFEKRQYRSALLTPCLNFEALFDSKPRFLRLLHNRTSDIAAAYFWDDVRALTFPLSTGLLSKAFNSNCLVTNGEQAGMLIPWDRERMHREEMCGFPVAKLVLESQELLLRQIRTIVDEVLAGLKAGSGAEKWRQAAEDDFQSIGSHVGASELQYPILEKPYGPPQHFHAIALHDLAMLRHDTLSDHLRDLQTDPPYMQSTIYEMTGAKEVLEKPNVSQKVEEHFWETSRNVWLWDYLRLNDWGRLEQVLAAIHDVAAKGVPGITKETILRWDCDYDLPSAYADEMSTLCRNIAAAWHDWILPLEEQCLQNFPGISKPHASRVKGDHFLEEDFCSYKTRRRLWSKDRLVWALLELFYSTEVDSRTAVDTTTVLAVLAGEMSRPDQRARLDVKGCLLIEDLLAVHLIWLAAMSHRPAFPRIQGKFTLTMSDPDDMNAERRTAVHLKQALIAVYYDKERNPRDVGPELKAVYQARWPKGPSSVEWLKKATAARTELGIFWDRWRGIARLAINDLWPDAYSQNYDLVKVLEFDLQSEYGDGVKAEELAIRSQFENRPRKRKSDDRPLARLAEPQEYIPHSSIPLLKEKVEPPQKKQKQKTIGTPAPQPEAEPQEQSPPTTPVSPEKPKIPVSKKSFEVLERMFPQESGNMKENTIRWKDVEGVLAEAGLSIEQGQGSAVTFKQEADGEKRASRFSLHRPHRDGDHVDEHILRRIGYRLKDRLGWKWKQFEVKKGR